jgi:hypothetical protein
MCEVSKSHFHISSPGEERKKEPTGSCEAGGSQAILNRTLLRGDLDNWGIEGVTW